MSKLDEMKNELGVRFIPVQWSSILENGMEVDVINNNMFNLNVLDLCKLETDPKSYIFNFMVGDEVISFGVKQRTEIVEKIVDGHLCTEIVPVPMNDHFLEIIDSKNGTLRTYSLQLIEEVVPNELKEINDDRDTYVAGHINITEYDVDEAVENPFEVEF